MKFEARLTDTMTLKIATLKKMFLAASKSDKLSFEEYMEKEHNLKLRKSKTK